MRYLGSKIKLLNHIEKVIEDNQIQGETFADLFAGTSCVGDYFKEKYTIISNDFLTYAYVFSKAKLMNATAPSYKKFNKKYGCNVFTWLNEKVYKVDDTFFVYNNYTPKGGRMFFTEENGIKIDGIRQEIECLYNKNDLNEEEYYFLIASLLESVTRYSNTSGTYEAYFKFWDPRAEKRFVIEPLEIHETNCLKKNEIYNEDTNKLIRNISGDIAYIDPPYTVTQYVSAYHMLETIAKYDSPKITGVGGKRNRGDSNSLYAQKTQVKRIFEDLFRQIQFKDIIVSYSNQGLIPLDELIELIKTFAIDGKVQVNQFDYKEYQNHRSSNKSNGRKLNEVLIYFKKDLSINKSPLNYSGSKDSILLPILKTLPANVDTFVDAMGGAFNVGANVSAMSNVVYNEANPYVFEIIQWLLNEDKEKIISDIEEVIDKFKLEKGNKEAYYALRNAYNLNPSPLYLYVLHMYSFQNMIRFNSSHQFNTPIGVAGYSEDIKQRIKRFKTKAATFTLNNLDYTQLKWDSYPVNTVFYFDPPYYITSASYNDGKRGMKGWGITQEIELLSILSHLNSMNYKFMLSNVLEHKGKRNELLTQWIEENHFRVIPIGVSGYRYAKNEILVVNY